MPSAAVLIVPGASPASAGSVDAFTADRAPPRWSYCTCWGSCGGRWRSARMNGTYGYARYRPNPTAAQRLTRGHSRATALHTIPGDGRRGSEVAHDGIDHVAAALAAAPLTMA